MAASDSRNYTECKKFAKRISQRSGQGKINEMSDLKKYEYTIRPEESFVVIHNCAGCGCKQRFINTRRFRVNANGNRLDVWLIYSCEKCRHTLNLSIYERVDKRKMPPTEYLLFLRNDEVLAEQYGMDYGFFKKNRVEVDWENVVYSVYNTHGGENICGGSIILVYNPYGIRIRPEKLVSMLLKLSRSAVKKQISQKLIEVNQQGTDLEIKFYGG